jgi:hypothetical protein
MPKQPITITGISVSKISKIIHCLKLEVRPILDQVSRFYGNIQDMLDTPLNKGILSCTP